MAIKTFQVKLDVQNKPLLFGEKIDNRCASFIVLGSMIYVLGTNYYELNPMHV